MSALTKRTTVYLEPTLHKALQLQSIETSRSISQLVNDAIREQLAEDAADLLAITQRADEPVVEFEDFVKRLRRDGTL
jgi:hypothetical protein